MSSVWYGSFESCHLVYFTVPSWCFLRDGTVPSRCFLRDSTVPSRCFLHDGTVPSRCFLCDGTVPSYNHYPFKKILFICAYLKRITRIIFSTINILGNCSKHSHLFAHIYQCLFLNFSIVSKASLWKNQNFSHVWII